MAVKTKAECKSLIEATRGKIARGPGSATDKAIKHLGLYTGSQRWRSEATVLMLASLYLDGRGVSKSYMPLESVVPLRAAVIEKSPGYSASDREWACKILAVPEYFNRSYTHGIRSYPTTDDYSGKQRVAMPNEHSAAERLNSIEPYWSKLGVNFDTFMTDGLVKYWLEYHASLWTIEAPSYVTAMNVAQGSNETRDGFVRMLLSGETSPSVAVLQALSRCLSVNIDHAEQKRAARQLADSNGNLTKTFVPHEAVAPGLKALLARTGELKPMADVLTRARSVTVGMQGFSVVKAYEVILDEFFENSAIKSLATAVQALGVAFAESTRLSGHTFHAAQKINGTDRSYSGDDISQLAADRKGALGVVTDAAQWATLGLGDWIVSQVATIYLEPVCKQIDALAAKSMDLIDSMPALVNELAIRFRRENDRHSYKYDFEAKLLDGEGPTRAFARYVDVRIENKDGELAHKIGDVLAIAECVAYAYAKKTFTTWNSSGIAVLDLATIGFGD